MTRDSCASQELPAQPCVPGRPPRGWLWLRPPPPSQSSPSLEGGVCLGLAPSRPELLRTGSSPLPHGRATERIMARPRSKDFGTTDASPPISPTQRQAPTPEVAAPHPGNAGSPRGLCQAVFAKYTAPRKYLAGVPRAPALWTHLWVAEAPPLPAPARAGDCGRPWALGAWELPRCLFVLGCLGGAATLCQLLA